MRFFAAPGRPHTVALLSQTDPGYNRERPGYSSNIEYVDGSPPMRFLAAPGRPHTVAQLSQTDPGDNRERPGPHALEDHGVDFARSDFLLNDFEDALSVLRHEALALRHVDGGQHLVDRFLGIRGDVLQELLSAALGHGHLEAALRDDGAVYLEQAPAAL